jgi:hypothetical protein
MSTQVQYRRGSASQNDAFTGALAEITVDTTNKTIRVHDGSTAGGSNVATVAYVTAQLAALSANAITFGTSNVQIPSSGSNIRINVGGTSNVAVFSTTGATVTGTVDVTGNVSGGNITTAGQVSATGNVSGGNLNVTGNIVDSGALSIITGSNGNITLAPNGTGVTVVNTDLRNGQANGVGNIGTSTAYFNTAFVKATSAQYADLAEYYASDRNYEPGTVIVFGGDAEVTQSEHDADDAVAGVVSTNPAYIMNAGIQANYSVPVALTGRVPTRVLGPVKKGNMMVSTVDGYARACATPQVGTVIGKALENFDGDRGVIEVVVGRM